MRTISIMSKQGLTYYGLKGVASASVAIAAGFIGFFSSNLFDGTDVLPFLGVIVIAVLVLVAKGAEARLDEIAANEDEELECSDTVVTVIVACLLFFVIVIVSLHFGTDLI